jgi:hypothetical protein
MCICAIKICYISIHILRVPTFIPIEQTGILGTIKELLQLTGLQQPFHKPPKKPVTLLPHSLPPLLTVGYFFENFSGELVACESLARLRGFLDGYL